jgi:hypothetical protein
MVEKKQSVPDETVPAKAPARSRGRPRVGDAAMDTSVGREALIDATIDLLKDMPPSAITPVLVARTTGASVADPLLFPQPGDLAGGCG